LVDRAPAPEMEPAVAARCAEGDPEPAHTDARPVDPAEPGALERDRGVEVRREPRHRRAHPAQVTEALLANGGYHPDRALRPDAGRVERSGDGHQAGAPEAVVAEARPPRPLALPAHRYVRGGREDGVEGGAERDRRPLSPPRAPRVDVA